MKFIMCLGFVAFIASCDTSKADLELTKSNLASVTKERDDLKTQVSSLQQQLDTSKAELTKAQAAETADKNAKTTMAAKSAASADKAAAGSASKGKHGHKS